MVRVSALIKFGAPEHLKEMVEGRLYLNALDFFRTLENDQVRADDDEGLSVIYQSRDVELRVNGELVSELASPIPVSGLMVQRCGFSVAPIRVPCRKTELIRPTLLARGGCERKPECIAR